MKLRKEDCVKFLVAAMPTTQKQDWKRRSKKRIGSVIARAFQNMKTGTKVVVFEQNDKLSYSDGWNVALAKPGKDWLFAIIDDRDFDAGFMVVTTDKGFWLKYHCVNDESPDRDMKDVLHRVGLSECMESSFEPDGSLTRDETKKRLEELGFVNDQAFQKFNEEHM